MTRLDQAFIGIIPIVPQLTYAVAIIDDGLRVLDTQESKLEEIGPLCSTYTAGVAALTLPRGPNLGLVQSHPQKVHGRGRPALEKINKRLCEALLNQNGLKTTATSADPETSPQWVKQGFLVYKLLEEGGFSLLPEKDKGKWVFETHAEGIFRALLGRPLLPQKSLEGRLQRQLILYEQGLRIADPMVFFEEVTRHRLIQGSLPLQTLLTIHELDALAVAYMAWLVNNKSQMIVKLGDNQEGVILLPYWKELDLFNSDDALQLSIFN